MNLVLEIFSLFTADLQISNCDRVTGVALSLLLPTRGTFGKSFQDQRSMFVKQAT